MKKNALLGTRTLAGLSVVLLSIFTGCSPPAPEPATASRQPQPTQPELSLPRTADYDYEVPKPGSYRLPVIQPAADGEVLGPDGKPRRLRELFGDRITVLSFIYTRCADPKACPQATGVLYQLHQISTQDPALADNLRLLTFSFDPEHDTPQVMEHYGHGFQSNTNSRSADWQFLTTRSPRELAPILQAYGQRVDRKKNPAAPTGPLYHNLRVYLIDREGRIRNIYSQGLLDVRLLVMDIRTALMEESSGQAGSGSTSSLAQKAPDQK